jgi:calcineurin-like phosphoesterase family protein
VSDVCQYAREIAHRYKTTAELAAAVSAARGESIGHDVLRCRYQRWRKRTGAPKLESLLGKGAASDFVDEATHPGPPGEAVAAAVFADAPPTEPLPDVQLPSGQRPSQLPPDHIVRIEPPPVGYVILTSDHHYPIHDRAAEAAVLALVQDLRPKVWVGNGDLIDAWWISRHEKEAERLVDNDAGVRIVDEVNAFRPFMAAMAGIVERGYIGMGNHEHRLSALINANPGLHGLPGLRWQSIFDPPANVQVMDYGYRCQMGPVSMVHGDRMGGRLFGVKHPTAWALDNQGARSVIFGHTHRMATTFRTTWEDTGPRQVVAINQGHLSDVAKQRYAVEPNWQSGFVLLDFWTEAGRPRYTPHLVPVINGTIRFAGKTYRA